jgi:hypothetical protein
MPAIHTRTPGVALLITQPCDLALEYAFAEQQRTSSCATSTTRLGVLNHLEKFPNTSVLLHHYLRCETMIEAYE